METDWKKKYEEALNKARELNGTVAAGRDFLAEIFPELAESEDERIRKMLIARVRTAEELNEELRERIIAYLEKKEQQEVNCDFYNKELSDIVSAELYKYSGPNSIKSPWALDSTGVQYPLYFANLGAKWQKKQKSGEWNKEDEKIRKALISLVDENAYTYKSFAGVDLYSMLAWLEKQKDNKFAPRVLPCSAAWFEDGEERQKEQKPKNILTNDDSLQTAYLKGQTDVLEDPEAYGLQKEQKPNYCHYGGDPNVERCKLCSAVCIGRLTEDQKPVEWSEVELEFRGEKVKVKRPFFRDDKGRGYSTTEQDEDVAWDALRAWCEKKGISLYDLYPKAEWSEEDEKIQEGIMQFLFAWRSDAKITKWLDWLKSLQKRFSYQTK